MTVEQNLAFGLQQRKTPKAEISRRVSEAAKMLGIGEYSSTQPPGWQSGSTRRRPPRKPCPVNLSAPPATGL
jgi:multiple sugar transport system ATP-binding protein